MGKTAGMNFKLRDVPRCRSRNITWNFMIWLCAIPDDDCRHRTPTMTTNVSPVERALSLSYLDTFYTDILWLEYNLKWRMSQSEEKSTRLLPSTLCVFFWIKTFSAYANILAASLRLFPHRHRSTEDDVISKLPFGILIEFSFLF